jgi:hypothetical protein
MLIRYVCPINLTQFHYADLTQCHTHPKIKDAPKRRRESSHTRALAASTIGKVNMNRNNSHNGIKMETGAPMTPLMTPSQSASNTATSRVFEKVFTIRESERDDVI